MIDAGSSIERCQRGKTRSLILITAPFMNFVLRCVVTTLLCIAAPKTLPAQTESPAPPLPAGEPAALYLTWQRDPAHTMTVHWHTVWTQGYRDPVLQYRREGATTDWLTAAGKVLPMPFTDRMVHTVELTGLAPDTRYVFRLGRRTTSEAGEFIFSPDGPEYPFQTLPNTLSRPVRFVSGGDVYGNGETFAAINRAVAAKNPDFALMGSDIAYANEQPKNASRWFEFLRIWGETMVAADGRLIPIVPAIGNHEVHGDTYDLRGGAPNRGVSPDRAPFFFSLFAFPGRPGYNVLDFGDYLSVVALDSFHANPVPGAQTEWLRDILAARSHVRHVVPLYHVPAYPSHRSFVGPVSVAIRANWVPLFDEHRVRFVFENHDHAYKVTHPLRAGERHKEGTRYLGDGAWAVGTRETTPLEKTPYLARAQSRNHLFVVTLQAESAEFVAVDPTGQEFDRFIIETRP